jgi:uncharacterized membrane protein
VKRIALYVMVLFYLAAGVNHFINPGFYLKIMPSWIPYHEACVLISGIFEILFSLFLLFPQTRRAGAWCIIILLIVIFPANIQMMLDYIHRDDPKTWITVLRLPIQLLLIWWAYIFTKANHSRI